MAPAGEQELPLSQRPTALVPTFWQRTFAVESGVPGPPQQSSSRRHSSPVGRQPLGGWQISTPEGPYGKQARLQQSPPQVGNGPPV